MGINLTIYDAPRPAGKPGPLITRRNNGAAPVRGEDGTPAGAASLRSTTVRFCPTLSTMLAGRDILILEDEPLWRRKLVAHLERAGASVTAVGTVAEAREAARHLSFDVALLDINLPDGEGFDLLREGLLGEATPAVVMTSEGGVERAVEALRLGARDYLPKPFEMAELPLVLGRCLARGREDRRRAHRSTPSGGDPTDQFWFGSGLAQIESQLERLLEADRRLAGRLPPVLLVGETGTGKTSLARWIHRRGPRADAPLVELNCSAVPENLAESELFGHERGAFTDAKTTRIGLFEAADGGTLFLDELPSLPQAVQAKLLKALEDASIRRVGGQKDIKVDVRIIAATHLDPDAAVASGTFRADLRHRLDLLRLDLPPLRERPDDIEPLATRLLADLARRYRNPALALAPAARARLRAWSWPGNVRELAHELERAVIMEGRDQLQLDALRSAAGGPGSTAAPDAAATPGALPGDWLAAGWQLPSEGLVLDDVTDRFIDLALEESGGNVSAAARRLGVTRDFLRYRLQHAPSLSRHRRHRHGSRGAPPA